MGKWTDKLYITHSEWATIYGGARANSGSGDKSDDARGFRRLPFDHCSLTLVKTRDDPVITPSGIVYERKAIEKRLDGGRAPSLCPVLSTPLSKDMLTSLTFAKNSQGTSSLSVYVVIAAYL